MKAFIILALTLTVNSSFLRELTAEAITLEDPVFTTKCIVSAVAGEIEFSVTVDKKDFSTADGFTATLKSGDDTFTVEGAADGTTKSKIVFSDDDIVANKTGIYTLSAVVDDTTAGALFTFTVPKEPKTSCRVADNIAIDAADKQTAAQTVKEGDDTAKSFKLVFASKLTIAPVIYGKSDGTVEIAGCAIDSADTTGVTVVCTPEGEELAEGENTIYYQKGCGTPETTGVKVTYTSDSSFLTFGKIALFVIAAILF
jgi:hypothetical protein